VAWAVPLGLLIGVVLGTLGGGGAILTVPVLVYVFAQTPAAATAGSLFIVGISSLLGLAAQHGSGNVRYRPGLVFGGLGVAGSALGSVVSVRIPGTVLLLAFAGLLLVVATVLVQRTSRTRPTEAPPGPGRPWPVQLGAALAVGLLTGFFGVGGGFAIVPALMLVMGFSMHSAAATSLLVAAINSAAALLTRWLIEPVVLDWPLIGTFSGCAAVGTLAGTRLARRLDQSQLGSAFAGLLIAVAGFLLIQNAGLLI
jgi:uncharacterized membrane protein YfcA